MDTSILNVLTLYLLSSFQNIFKTFEAQFLKKLSNTERCSLPHVTELLSVQFLENCPTIINYFGKTSLDGYFKLSSDISLKSVS